MFLVLEGIEGSGKSTQAARLEAWLRRLGHEPVVAREPGGTALGERIRDAVLRGGDPVPARSELLLILAARAALMDDVVEPALADGRIVLLDRFELSTFAYQGYGRGLPLDELRRLNAFATGGRRPDLTVVLSVPTSAGEQRRAARGGAADRIEEAGRAFHERVARGYDELARNEPSIEVVDGTATPDAVEATIRALLGRRFPETFEAAQG